MSGQSQPEEDKQKKQRDKQNYCKKQDKGKQPMVGLALGQKR